MLILPKHLEYPTKNPFWADQTPNELYTQNDTYRDMVDEFIRFHQIPGTGRFIEVRITREKETIEILQGERWWDDPLFMEKVFWVFDKPLLTKVKDDGPMGFVNFQSYFLEPFECQRVNEVGRYKFGYPPFPADAAIMIPVTCATMAWDETSAGLSDHIRYRPEVELTDLEQQLVGAHKEEIANIQKTLVDVSTNEEFLTDAERTTKRIYPTS